MNTDDLERANGLVAELAALKKAIAAWSGAMSWRDIGNISAMSRSPAFPQENKTRFPWPSDAALHITKSVVVAEFEHRARDIQKEIDEI